jgi:hypothetical protein
MKTYVEFRSDRFPAYEGEEEQTNPGSWGKRLAEFLRDGLKEGGFHPAEPVAEDWGWIVPVSKDPCNIWIGCGRYQEYPDSYLCFIEPHTPVVRKFFKKIDVCKHIESIQKILDKILTEESGIKVKKWWTHDEFNNPEKRIRDSK